MDDKQFIMTSIPLRQLNTIICVAVNEAMKSYQPIQVDQTELPEKLLTVQDAAKFLTLSVPTIYSLISKGELPVMKRSKRCYFSKKELIEYIRVGRRKTNTEIQAEAETYLIKKKGGNNE